MNYSVLSKCLSGLLLALVLLTSGCNTALRLPTLAPQDPLKARAEQQVAAGNYQAAAQVYLDSANTLPSAEAAARQLTAAEYLLRGNQWQAASSVIDRVNKQALSGTDHDRWLLIRARLQLAEQQPDQALETLDRITAPDLLPDSGLDYYRLRTAINQALGDMPAAIRQRVWLDGLLTDREQMRRNQQTIWQDLSALPDADLQQLRSQLTARDTLAGWVELAYLVRLNRYSSAGLEPVIESWRRDYPGHPAEREVVPDLLDQAPQSRTLTGKVALLLPLSGRMAKQAAAIRDGVMIAHSQNTLSQSDIMLYDTDAEPVWQSYQNAIANGADIVIGPLLKNRIRDLAASGQLTVPVLALNQIEADTGLSQPLYQFGLNPEDEARQAAERARQDGHQRMVALVPESAWGERVLNAFTQRWHALGGSLLAIERYPAKSTDFSKYIKRMLDLDDSVKRQQALVRRLGRRLEFEPRRRQDVDAVFIVAFPREARQIRPQLQFHRAGDLPVYATSHIYTGTPDPQRDQDLDGIRFCDTPWTLGETGDSSLLRSRISELWQGRADHYQRLFALGIDAYRVIPWLETPASRDNSTGFTGMTGNLYIDDRRRLHRRLDCARFKDGIPEKLERLPELPVMPTQPAEVPQPASPAIIRWSTDR